MPPPESGDELKPPLLVANNDGDEVEERPSLYVEVGIRIKGEMRTLARQPVLWDDRLTDLLVQKVELQLDYYRDGPPAHVGQLRYRWNFLPDEDPSELSVRPPLVTVTHRQWELLRTWIRKEWEGDPEDPGVGEYCRARDSWVEILDKMAELERGPG